MCVHMKSSFAVIKMSQVKYKSQPVSIAIIILEIDKQDEHLKILVIFFMIKCIKCIRNSFKMMTTRE